MAEQYGSPDQHGNVSCAGEPHLMAVSWDDLPAELREDVIAMVPLLRLAQLASVTEEFREAYHQRLAAHMAAADRVRCSSKAHLPTYSEEILIRRGLWRRIANTAWNLVGSDMGVVLPPYWGVRTTRLKSDTNVSSPSVLSKVNGMFSRRVGDTKPHEPLWVCADRGAVLVVALKRQRASCEALKLSYYYDKPCPKPTPTTFFVLCTAMMPSLYTFLHANAGGSACGVDQGARAGVIQSVTLVVPKGMAWPNEGEEAALCDAITCVLALVRGKPSGVRVAVTTEYGEHVETSWRLPCAIGGR
jgi:hypothetical protein